MTQYYRGNPNLKQAGEVIEWTPDLIQEYMKCMNDPIYFAHKYVKVVSLDHGFVPIKLYPYQIEAINALTNNRRVVMLTSRQAGKCVAGDTDVRVRDDETGEVHEMSISNLHETMVGSNDVVSTHPPQSHKHHEAVLVNCWSVETQSGLFAPIETSYMTVPMNVYEVVTDCGSICCADDHILFDQDGCSVFAKDLITGSFILKNDGRMAQVIKVVKTGNVEPMFDLSVASFDNVYSTNGFLSHNTTSAVVMILHYVLFNSYKTAAVLSNNDSGSKEILDRLKMAYEALPKWLQQGVLEWNKSRIELENGCKVISAATSSASIRGRSVNLLYVDENAFIDNWTEFAASVLPTISSGQTTKIFYTSTPNGLNHFYSIWSGATGENDVPPNGFIPIRALWNDVPGRDEKWKQETLASLNYDYDKFAQEYEGMFIGSSGTLIKGETLKSMVPKHPIMTQNDTLRQYVAPSKDRAYALVADVSRGKGQDYSAFSVFDVTEMPYQQVCVFGDNLITPADYAVYIHNIGKMYNEAMVLIELNDIGGQVADILFMDLEYENLIMTKTAGRIGKRISASGGADRGIRTTTSVKSQGCATLKLMLEQNQLVVNDKATIDELKKFSRRGNSYQAESGSHDDLVMGLVLFSWMTSDAYFKELTDIDTMGNLREKSDSEIEEELLPFGFFDDGLSDSTPQSSYASTMFDGYD